MRLPHLLRRFVGYVAGSRGLGVVPRPERAFVDWCRRLDVGIVLDVGANEGTFVRGVRALGFRGRICCFEPNSQPRQKLSLIGARDSGIDIHPYALGELDSQAMLKQTRQSVFSSFLEVHPETARHSPGSIASGVERVEVRRLDGLWRLLGLQDGRVAMKSDTQGYDLAVLRGAGERLAEVRLVLVELSLNSIYSGQPQMHEVHEWLKRSAFRLVGVWPVYSDPATSELMEIDGLYVNARFL